MRIAIGCDHRGVKLKQAVIKYLSETGHSYVDFGCFTEETVDYPDIAGAVARAVAKGDFERGVLICDSGVGMSMAANKVRGIRAALVDDAVGACRARQHNDANVICLAARKGEAAVPGILGSFLTCEFEGGRHLRRVEKMRAMEDQNC